MADRQAYRMMPAPRANPQGRLDGAWIVQTRIHYGAPWVTVARFQADGRDACEAWAHKHGRTFEGRCHHCGAHLASVSGIPSFCRVLHHVHTTPERG
jgi:hypothetical protein